jgi:hypothetical protein
MSINLQNIQWKIHVEETSVGNPENWFKAFAPWIPDSPEVFVDVADYSHVQDGPVIFLSGHVECFSLDKTTGRYGLLYERRQPADGTNAEKLHSSLKSLLAHAARLESDSSFPAKPNFLTGDVKFIVNNRGVAPNNDETLATLRPELEALFDQVFGKGAYTLEREKDVRQRFMVHVKAKAAPSLAAALKQLG